MTLNRVQSLARLSWLFDELVKTEHLILSKEGIESASLSPSDRWARGKCIPEISTLLYEEMASTGIPYDALASIPAGGDRYVDHIADLVLEREGKRVPRIVLKKGYDGPYNGISIGGGTKRAGLRVMVVDDSIYTGAMCRKVAAVLASQGHTVSAFLCAADLEYEYARGISSPVVSVFNTASLARVRRMKS